MDPTPIGTPPLLADLVLRLAIAASLGLVLGLDRELRRLPAGLPSHGMVRLGAAVTTPGVLLKDGQVDTPKSGAHRCALRTSD